MTPISWSTYNPNDPNDPSNNPNDDWPSDRIEKRLHDALEDATYESKKQKQIIDTLQKTCEEYEQRIAALQAKCDDELSRCEHGYLRCTECDPG